MNATTFDEPTPVPLLEELAVAGSEAGWQRFVYLYGPFLRGRLRRYTLQPSDEEDLMQDVFAVVLRKLPEFRHNGRAGAFRCWLRQIVVHATQTFFRHRRRRPESDMGAWAEQMADDGSPLAAEWDREHDRHVTARLLELVRAEFSQTDYELFRLTTLDGVSAADAARQFEVEPNVVYIAKSRMLARLREIGRGLMPEE